MGNYMENAYLLAKKESKKIVFMRKATKYAMESDLNYINIKYNLMITIKYVVTFNDRYYYNLSEEIFNLIFIKIDKIKALSKVNKTSV
jgi:hypothetical protein